MDDLIFEKSATSKLILTNDDRIGYVEKQGFEWCMGFFLEGNYLFQV